MGVEAHKELLSNIGLDVEKHAKMMAMGLEAYQNQFLNQPNRPERMKYFDWFMSEIQGERIAEINRLRANNKPAVGTFCIFVPEEIVVGAGGGALNPFLRHLLSKKLEKSVIVPTSPQLMGSLGAAMAGLEVS
jgi:hypothetical protein